MGNVGNNTYPTINNMRQSYLVCRASNTLVAVGTDNGSHFVVHLRDFLEKLHAKRVIASHCCAPLDVLVSFVVNGP